MPKSQCKLFWLVLQLMLEEGCAVQDRVPKSMKIPAESRTLSAREIIECAASAGYLEQYEQKRSRQAHVMKCGGGIGEVVEEEDVVEVDEWRSWGRLSNSRAGQNNNLREMVTGPLLSCQQRPRLTLGLHRV